MRLTARASVILCVLTLTVCGRAAPARIRVACVGDSITEGGYPTVLAQCLGRNYEVRDFGVSGATLMKAGPNAYSSFGKLEEIRLFAPQIVTILLGTNDRGRAWTKETKAEFLADYKELIAACRGFPGRPRVYAMIPLPVFGEGGEALRGEVTGLIIKAARSTDTDTIDLFTPLAGSASLFPDGVHPNAAGTEILARTICQALSGAPLFEPDAGSFVGTLTVKLRSANAGDIVRYTLDGSDPTATSPVYTAPIRLSESTTIKAVAIGQKPGLVKAATYTRAATAPWRGVKDR